MGRQKVLDDTQVRWAFGEWVRGCKLVDVAAVLGVTRRTLYNEFRRRGWGKPKPIPDEDWFFPTL